MRNLQSQPELQPLWFLANGYVLPPTVLSAGEHNCPSAPGEFLMCVLREQTAAQVHSIGYFSMCAVSQASHSDLTNYVKTISKIMLPAEASNTEFQRKWGIKRH